MPNLLSELQRETSSWADGYREQTLVAEQLLKTTAKGKGGILMVHAPTEELERLETECTDDGYMAQCAQELNLWNVTRDPHTFEQLVVNLSEHSEGDVWPDGSLGAGLPKDGAWGISATGVIRLVAVKFLTDAAPYTWPKVGMRRTSGLSIAYRLKFGVVFMRSESGDIFLITADSAKSGRIFKAASSEIVVGGEPAEAQSCRTTQTVSCRFCKQQFNCRFACFDHMSRYHPDVPFDHLGFHRWMRNKRLL
jgi:hypothetical protein